MMPYKYAYTGMEMANFKNSYDSLQGLSHKKDLAYDDMHGQFWN